MQEKYTIGISLKSCFKLYEFYTGKSDNLKGFEKSYTEAYEFDSEHEAKRIALKLKSNKSFQKQYKTTKFYVFTKTPIN